MSSTTLTPRFDGQRRDLGDEILLAIVDDVVGADVAAESRLVGAADGRERGGAEALASWIAVRPMPLVPPWIRIVSPARKCTRSKTLFQTVK